MKEFSKANKMIFFTHLMIEKKNLLLLLFAPVGMQWNLIKNIKFL